MFLCLTVRCTLIYLILIRISTQVSLNDLDLIMVHSVWRHGDRSPERHQNNDPVDEDEWNSGGGGLGQLTTNGMGQQYLLGQLLRDRYIQTTFPGFLSQYYESNQIFIRSTDVNRTVSSAMSNMLGMYPVGRPGIDYPNITGWPYGFVPIPIHSGVENQKDFVANAEFKCPRRDELQEIAHSGDEFQTYLKSDKYIETTTKFSNLFGIDISYKNMYQITDTINTQLIHFPERVKSLQWFTDGFYKDIEDIERKNKGYHVGKESFKGTIDGLYDPPIVKGINVRKEIQKLKGGSLVNEVSGRMRTKVNCHLSPNKCYEANKNLKYYAYSTHDHTLMSLLTIFEIEDIVAGREKHGEWPDFAACITIELFVQKDTKISYFRMLYHRNENATFETVTHLIKGCKSEDFCDFKIFEYRAKEYRLDQPIDQACQKQNSNANELRLTSKGTVITVAESKAVWKENIWVTFVTCTLYYFIQFVRD